MIVRLEYVHPPIPVRDKDWCAYPDGEEETGPYGYGASICEALRDLADELEAREDVTA